MSKAKIIYLVATGLLTALLLMAVGMYVFNNPATQVAFTTLGYPTYLIYPLAAAKILGLAAIWSNAVPRLTKMAYAGFFFNFVLAVTAHLAVGDGQFPGAFMALLFLGASYWARHHGTADAPAAIVTTSLQRAQS